MPVRIIYLYAHEDEALLDKLRVYLKPLKRLGVIDWYDRNINAGSEWGQEIDRHISEADIILLLVSPDFLASDYYFGKEMKQAMERHERREAQVIPVILRPVYWQGAPFGKLKALPTNEIPVTSSKWHDLDEAFLDIAEGIREVVELYLVRIKDPSYAYIRATSGKSVLTDPLSCQSASDWLVGDWDDSKFFFSEGAFHLTVKKHPIYAPSIARATHFSDFAFQVEMTLITGDCGGIVFRSGVEVANGYWFVIGRDYARLFCAQKRLFSGKTLSFEEGLFDAGPCGPAMEVLNQAHLLTVVAKGSNIFLYINKHCVAQVQDNTAKSGKVGLMAISYRQDTHVQFRNIQVWDLRESVLSFF